MSPHPSESAAREELRRACAELERRLRAGAGRAEDLLGECPAVAADHEAALELIYTEFVLRQELGQRPSPQDWYARFPRWRDDLAQLFEVHRFACAGLADTRPGDSRPGGPAAPGLVGRRLGAYELLEELGRGGMGVVYKARQAGLDRLVAVKLILTGDYSGPKERARFRLEAEAVARLDHPNIVQVHEVGEHDGRPFYSMEYVTGGHLASRLVGDPWPSAEASALIRTLALAVEHAHRRGIVHRDLKPANILLTAEGTPKITDFGLARRLPDADRKTVPAEGRTLSGAVLGTPSYMAPEQAGGDRKDVTPAADVYSLGSILYELLTGRPPFEGANALEILDQLRLSDPAPPRALRPKVPRDLETVCLKCLQKEPARRYAGAADLAEDLRRFQAGEPVVARPVGRLGRAAKWARRRPAVAAMIGVVAGLVAVMVAGVALAFEALRDEQVRTAKQRDLAERHLEQARRAEEEARQAVDECFGLARDDPRLQADRLRKVRQLLLAKTLPFYKGFAQRAPDDPALAERRAEYLFRVAFITQEIGSKAEALASFEQARESYEKLSEAHPGTGEYRAGLGRCWINVATMQADLGKFPEAGASYRRAVDILGPLSEAHPGNADYRAALASAWDNLGVTQTRAVEHRAALESLTQVRDLLARLVQDQPRATQHHLGLARTYNNLGSLLGRMGKPEDRLASYEKALLVLRRLDETHPKAPRHRAERAAVLTSLSLLQGRTDKREEAQRNARQAAAILSALHGAYPDVTLYQVSLAAAWEALGLAQPDPAEALRSTEQAWEVRKKLVEADPDVVQYRADLAYNHWRRGALLTQLKRDEEAEKGLREALLLQEGLHAAHPVVPRYRSDLAGTCTSLGTLLQRAGRKDEALGCYRRALGQLAGLTRGPSAVTSYQVRLAEVCYRTGLLLRDTDRAAESLELFADAVAALQNVRRRYPDPGQAQANLRDIHRGRAKAYQRLGRQREAAADWGQAALLETGPFRQQLLAWQALSLARAGEHAEATRLAGPLAAPPDAPGAVLLDLARAYALAARAAERDNSRPLAERERRAEGHAREAIALLGRASAAGQFRERKAARDAENDPAFRHVRGRDDFRRWQAALAP